MLSDKHRLACGSVSTTDWRCGIERAALTRVLRLFRTSDPPTIVRCITFRVINSVDGIIAFWFKTHISNKSGVRMLPLRTNSYATTTIIFVIFVVWIIATVEHRAPREVSGSAFHSMRRASFSRHFNLEATTRLSVPVFEMACVNYSSFTAGAKAEPQSSWFSCHNIFSC